MRIRKVPIIMSTYAPVPFSWLGPNVEHDTVDSRYLDLAYLE